MRACVRLSGSTIAMALCIAFIAVPARAQTHDNQHVVALEVLNEDAARLAEKRQWNEAAVRHLLSSDAGKHALKSANTDYAKVDSALRQLSDEELAKLADRSRQAEEDFAAGSITAKTLAYIILALVVIITIIVIV